jgi:hypothetical protein
MFVTSFATSKGLSPPAYIAGMEVDKPMHSIEIPTTTQPTEDALAEGELAGFLGAPSALAGPDAAAPDDREVRGGAPMLTSIAGGAP